VGRIVLDGIQQETFWLFTHPQFGKTLRKQLEAMLDGGILTKA